MARRIGRYSRCSQPLGMRERLSTRPLIPHPRRWGMGGRNDATARKNRCRCSAAHKIADTPNQPVHCGRANTYCRAHGHSHRMYDARSHPTAVHYGRGGEADMLAVAADARGHADGSFVRVHQYQILATAVRVGPYRDVAVFGVCESASGRLATPCQRHGTAKDYGSSPKARTIPPCQFPAWGTTNTRQIAHIRYLSVILCDIPCRNARGILHERAKNIA
jgi:hypothetical protein